MRALVIIQYLTRPKVSQMMFGTAQYYSDQRLLSQQDNRNQGVRFQGSNSLFMEHFKSFINNFSRQNKREYHQQLRVALQYGRYVLKIEISDLKAFDEALYLNFVRNPLQILQCMEAAVASYVRQKPQGLPLNSYQQTSWQVIIRSRQNPRRLRDIKSDSVNKLFVINGIVISCTKPYIKASKLKLKCKDCQATKFVNVPPGQFPFVPTYCTVNGGKSKCKPDPFYVMPDSTVIDTQMMKIQQNPQEIPTGQIARTYPIICDRYNVGKCVPGDRVRLTGVMLVQDVKGPDNLSKGTFYVTGIDKIKQRTNVSYTPQEQELFKKMSKDPKIIQKIYRSVAPGIYGNEDIKKTIACMLFGGSRKYLPDNTELRGDINVLLIGDPSTAKSQFLKFVQQTSNVAVYTSGKGSSAAGLTASITKDPHSGQFQIEGGALVLADGGIVCIDEFDKMKPSDRVAIHQAMEQQTISIAKAGITTRLKSRTSVLAAANPIFGRYDDSKRIAEQILMQTTILSRFDCVFIVRDINTPQNNQKMASHILNLHQGKIQKKLDNADLPLDLLKKYIAYARVKIVPRLSGSAAEKLQNIYIADRKKARENSSSSLPITVRQLQAVIRLSESIAKMRLRQQVSIQDVQMAHHLFEVSTMKTMEGKEFGSIISPAQADEIMKIEALIRKKIAPGNYTTIQTLRDDLNCSPLCLDHAIHNLISQGDFREIKNKHYLIRQK